MTTDAAPVPPTNRDGPSPHGTALAGLTAIPHLPDTQPAAEGPFMAPAFGTRRVPVVVFKAAAKTRDPLDALLRHAATRPPAGPEARERAGALRALIAAERIGGPALPDPGPHTLGVGPGEAVIVVDPCDPDRGDATARLWQAAVAGAGARPVRAVRDPAAAPTTRPCLAATSPDRLAAWTILDAAGVLHVLDGDLGLLALAAGRAVSCDPAAPYAPWATGGTRDGLDLLATLAELACCTDPFTRRPIRFDAALRLLGLWRRREAENRRIAVCVGMSFWKRPRIAALLASERGTPAFRRGTGAALSEAVRRGGDVAVWASRCPSDLPRRAAEAGITLHWLEDGFIRSTGLGAGFQPGASVTIDRRGPYYDPGIATDLERLLATAEFPPDLIARADTLVAALRDRGATKYNLGGALPDLPPADGRRRILVPGQVTDDLSILRGAAGSIRTDHDLLQVARQAEPEAVLIYKPHPDVVAGHRRGGVPAAEARALADVVLPAAPMAPLLDAIDAVHTITSLTGFEALLRGRAVTCWGQPFYAGWGLTDDRAPIPRRRRRLTLAELVAGALILYPRYIDPVTDLPCMPETLLDRLADPTAWRAGPVMRLRALQGGLRAAWRRLRDRGAAS